MLAEDEFFQVEVEEIEEVCDRTTEVEALMRSVNTTFDNYVRLNKKIPPEMVTSIAAVDDPAYLADKLVGHLGIKLEDKQSLLECTNPAERLERILGYMRSELEILEVEKRIRSRVKKQMEKTQKEYYLNEQMRAIQKELGEKDEFKNEIQELEEKLRQKKMPAEAREKCEREIKKLKMMSPMSAEATVVRNYLDWFLALPWFEYTEDKLDIKEAERILEEDHLRPREGQAAHPRIPRGADPGRTAQGSHPLPGRTSGSRQNFARQIGRARDRRASSCASRSAACATRPKSAAIAAPISARCPARSSRACARPARAIPVMLFDEVDKMSTDFRGDPSSALLEVLDPEQNCTFNDHYLDCDYDLSKVMFITTANTLDRIPRPLAGSDGDHPHPRLYRNREAPDRQEVPAQEAARGERAEGRRTSSSPTRRLLGIIRHYTREAGVRNLEREIASICRKVAVEVVKTDRNAHVKVSASSLAKYLGPPKFRYGMAETEPQIGVATGLAWTELGGELLGVEVTIVPGRGKLTITGQLGEVMQESAQAAMSYVRSRAEQLGLPSDFYQKIDIHISYSRGRDSQGRAVGRDHAGDGAGLGAVPRAGAQRPRDDRRDHAARTRAADRRAQGEGPGGASRRHQDGADPEGKRKGRRGNSAIRC